MSNQRASRLRVALRRRKTLRAGLVEAFFALTGLVLGLIIPQISAGPTIDAAGVWTLMASMAAAMVAFMGIVFSLLFLVVQFGSTTWTPRLNLFRDNPMVWRSFGYFLGVVVWSAASALESSSQDQVSVLVPVVGVSLVLGGLALFRKLQVEAFESIQLAPILHSVVEQGREVIDALYSEPYDSSPAVDAPFPEVRGVVRWPHHSGVLRQIDLPALLDTATSVDGIVELTVKVGDIVREGEPIVVVRGGTGDIDVSELLASLDVGIERTMFQDPRFAFRLLADIALRALSSAINDQTTGVQVIDAIDSLLSVIATRDLNIRRLRDDRDRVQVVLPVPDWDEYVDMTIGDIARSGGAIAAVAQRLIKLIDDLLAVTPPERQDAPLHWRAELQPIAH